MNKHINTPQLSETNSNFIYRTTDEGQENLEAKSRYIKRLNNLAGFAASYAKKNKCIVDISNPTENKAMYQDTHFVVDGYISSKLDNFEISINIIMRYKNKDDTIGITTIIQSTRESIH